MRKLFLFIAATLVSAGMWAGEITVTPPALTNITTTSYGLYTMTHSSTAASSGSKISSGAITTGTKGDVITINFATTKSDLYIKSVTFNSLSNGTIGSDDGSYNTSTGVFTVTGNKTSVNVVLTSADNQKGSVKITNVVINTGDNDVETITFTSFDSSAKTFGFTSSAATSAISSISSNNSNSVSSNILSWSGSRTLVFASSSNKFKYIAFLLNDGKAYTGFSADLGTYSDNYTWIGDTKTITFTNGTGGGRYIKNVYVITEPVPTHTLEWNFAGGTCSAEAGTDYTAGGQVEEGATITYPANNTMSKDGYDFNGWSTSVTTMPATDLTITAQWTEHAVSSDATLADLTVAGETIEGFDPATIEYNVELPLGTSVVPVVAGTAKSPYAKSVEANQAAALPGVATIVVTAEDNSTKTYTINFTVAESKDIIMVWKTGNAKCNTEASYVTSDVILSTDDAVKDYLSISFEQTTEDNTKKAEEKSGSYLSTGKSIGNLVKITAKTGYAFKAMGFYGKIETAEEKCPVSINGGKSWIDVTGNLGSDAKHCDVFTNAETAEIILKNNGGAGTWIRHMELTIINSEVTPTAINNTDASVKAVKVLRNGQLFIEKNGHVYNVLGGCVK